MELDHAELQEMLANDPYMLLVDVRDEEEFDAGHIPGAGNMSVDDIVDCLFDEALGERGLDAIANGKGMELSDDASVIVLYSNAGERSARACEHMESLGYVNVYNAPGLSSWPYEVVTTAEEAAVAARLRRMVSLRRKRLARATIAVADTIIMGNMATSTGMTAVAITKWLQVSFNTLYVK